MKPIILKDTDNFIQRIAEEEASIVEIESFIKKITEAVSNEIPVIVRGSFDKKSLYSLKLEIFNFGQNTAVSNHKNTAKVKNFHRIDHNHPLMSVKRIAHFFRYSYYEQDTNSVFKLIHPINILRNLIAGLDMDYGTFSESDDGFLTQPGVLHYPAGGGYMAAHTDNVVPQKVEVVLALSERMVDFYEGGLSMLIDDEWQDIEQFINFGDICIFKADVPHRVLPIDPDIKIDWSSSSGRWSLFSPIANIYSNKYQGIEVEPLNN